MSNFVNLKFKHVFLAGLPKQFILSCLMLLLVSFSALGRDDVSVLANPSRIDNKSRLMMPKREDGISKIEGGVSIKILYSAKEVDRYKGELSKLFPNVKLNPPQTSDTVLSANLPIYKVEMQEISCSYGSLEEQIMYTEGIMDSVVITLSNPENNLMFIYPHIWEKHQYELEGSKEKAKLACTKQSFSELKKKLDELDQNLPASYKDKTDVTLVTYYLSKNLFQLGTFLEERGFKIGAMYFHDAVIDTNNNIYFDPRHISLESGVPRTQDDQELSPRNVSLIYTGEILIDSPSNSPRTNLQEE